jgi:predicted nucleic acid-binding protein
MELTKEFFKTITDYQVNISETTLAEINQTPELEQKESMKSCIGTFTILTITESIERLAKEYIRIGAIPEKYLEDALHIAIAVENKLEYLLSWNFSHMVKRKTKELVNTYNQENKYSRIEIITPAEM